MKRIAVLFLSIVIFVAAVSVSPVSAKDDLVKIEINGQTYVRTFYDDFDGYELDDTKWSRSPETYRQGDYCKWSKQMSYLDGKGNLILACKYDTNGDLLCGAIRSRDRFEQCYGYFEASVKLQQVDGFWSAFWLMPKNIDLYGEDGGGDGSEIDIFEAFGYKKKGINHAVHYDGYGSRHKSIGKSITADVYDGSYHKFSLLWDKNKYVFYIDDKETYRITSAQVDISYVPTYLKFSLESSYGWTGKPAEEDLPSGISVDYVSVYQQSDIYISENVVYGDLNQDLRISPYDLLLFKKYLLNEKVDIKEENADLNEDGAVDLKDYLILKKYGADLITDLPYKDSYDD